MRIRTHGSFGHGLEPGTDHDISCSICVHERAAGVTPSISGSDDFQLDLGKATDVLLSGLYGPSARYDAEAYLVSRGWPTAAVEALKSAPASSMGGQLKALQRALTLLDAQQAFHAEMQAS